MTPAPINELSQGKQFDIDYKDKQVLCLSMSETEMPNGCRAG